MNTTVEATSHEAAAQQTPLAQQTPSAPPDTFTPNATSPAEALAPAFAAVTVDTHPSTSADVKTIFSMSPSGNPPYIDNFHQAFAAASVNPDFLRDVKKVEKATAAMKLPNPEDRVRAQLRVNAEKKLYADAAKRAGNGEQFVLPTKAEIDAKVEEGVAAWRSKQPK